VLNHFKNIKTTSFQKDILSMFRGTIIAQIIGVIGSIYLAKIYGSEAYGFFGLFISISSVLTIINTLQLDNLIITIKNKNESKNLMNSLFIISLIMAFISFIIYIFLVQFFDLTSLNLSVISLSILASIIFSFNKIHESFFTFRKTFIPISNAKVLIVIFNICFQLALFVRFNLSGLVVGNILSIFIINIYYLKKNKKYFNKIDIEQLKNSIKTSKSILKYNFPSTLINSLAINLMPILIVTYFNLNDSGVYFLSLKLLGTPLFLISSSISQVYYQKSSEMFYTSKENLFTLTKKIVLTNIVIMIIFIILINTIGIYFLELLFDKNWDDLRLYTLILSFLILARSSFNPISNIIIVLNKNHVSLIFNSYLLFVNLAAILFGYLSNSLINTIIFLSIFGGLGYIALLIYFMKRLKELKS
jgi:O-antigen/teichoic acid export membrane protein